MKRPAAILLALLLASTASALDVREALWGFDGKTVPCRFNPVSIFLENPTAAPYDGTLTLYRTDAVGRRLGADIVEPCFVSPFVGKWVQFYVYVSGEDETWRLAWGRSAQEQAELPRRQLGPPARVLLRDPEALAGAVPGMRTLPDNLFPTSCAGTEALHSVLLDHVPRWESARRQAFLDWIYTGGTLHLLMDESGHFPAFAEELSVLNLQSDQLRIGAGLVVRHGITAKQATDEFLANRGFPAPQLKLNQDVYLMQPEQIFFERLRGMTHPKHNWPLIYLMTAAYIAVVVPVNYFLGRKARDYRRTLAFFLAAVACFAFLFQLVGRRGYGESAAVHTLSYARPLARGEWDVTQWPNAFVLKGAYYTVSHPCPHNLYATSQEFETVNGLISNGAGGKFVVDIPLYSSRAFLHRGKVAADDLALKVAEWKGQEQLESFALEGTIPDGLAGAWACYRGRIYSLSVQGARLRVFGTGQTLEEFFNTAKPELSPYRRYPMEDDPQSVEAEFKRMLTPLLSRALGGVNVFRYSVVLPEQSDGRAQVFIAARSPAKFGMAEGSFGRETGTVLYHLTFYRSEN